jgi:hypothetical protein
MKITRPPSPAVADAAAKLERLTRPFEEAVERHVEQKTLGDVAKGNAERLAYTEPKGFELPDSPFDRGRNKALVQAALQDIDTALAREGTAPQARGVLGTRLKEAVEKPEYDLLALIRTAMSDQKAVSVQLAEALPLTAEDAKVLTGGAPLPGGARMDSILDSMKRQYASDLAAVLKDLAVQGHEARAAVEDGKAERYQAFVEMRATQAVEQLRAAQDATSSSNVMRSLDKDHTGVTKDLLQGLERLLADIPQVTQAEVRSREFLLHSRDPGMYLDVHGSKDGRTAALIDGIRTLVAAVRTQVEAQG